MNFAKFLRTPFLLEHLWWLLLYGPELKQETKNEINLSDGKKAKGFARI